MASIAILTTHPVAMLLFVLAVALTCAFFGTDAREDVSAVARLGGWLLTYFPLMLWTSRYAGQSWSKAGLATLVAVYLIQLIVQLQTTGKTRLLRWPDVAALHLNGLGTFGVADAMVMYDVRLVTIGWIAAGFALWQAAIAFRLFTDRRGHALHYVALGGTLATIAIGLIFRGPWVTMGWAVEGAAVIWLGLRERRDWLRVGGVLLFAVAVARLLDLLFTRTGGGLTPVFNTVAACAALVIALTYWIARLHRGMAGHATAIVAAQLLTLAVVSSEINRYWAASSRATIPTRIISAGRSRCRSPGPSIRRPHHRRPAPALCAASLRRDCRVCGDERESFLQRSCRARSDLPRPEHHRPGRHAAGDVVSLSPVQCANC
jgi:hypothetical protein